MRAKERRARDLMDREGLDALAVCGSGNFAWLTCGGSNYISIASESGPTAAVITRGGKYIVCDNIESPRIADEEVGGLGFEIHEFAWYEGGRERIISKLASGGTIGSDVPMEGARDVASAVQSCRRILTEAEIERYKWLGANAGECLSLACREIEPGNTEHEIAGLLGRYLYARGIVPTLALIGTDERISRYRHPQPTDRKLQRVAMLVIGARRWGLIASATRMVHFGPLPAELRRRHDAVTRVDAALIAATKPGARMGDIFRLGMDAYAQAGFPGEWKLHHQGGPTGYRARDFLVNETTDAVAAANQAFAWNPSITGAKSEDTIIATSSGPIILSASDDWPKIEVEIGDATIARPDVMVR